MGFFVCDKKFAEVNAIEEHYYREYKSLVKGVLFRGTSCHRVVVLPEVRVAAVGMGLPGVV